jgi:hypothetical protein
MSYFIISKAKEMYYNKMLTASTNKSKAPWKIINNATGHAPKKKFIPPELKSGNKKSLSVKQHSILIHIS